jgi:hypothetical protein
LRNPSAGLPAARSWSFTSAIIAATLGEEADVPLTPPTNPSASTKKFQPWSETSG